MTNQNQFLGVGQQGDPSLMFVENPAAAVTNLERDGRLPEDDERVVFHESAHAVIGRQLHGTQLGGVTVEPGDSYSGMVWGALFDRRLKFNDVHSQAPNLCEQVAGQLPGIGECRFEIADLYLHIFHQLIELTAGTEAERLFCPGEPLFAYDDERQAVHYASLITSSAEAGMALIAACRVEAVALLKASAHIVRAMAAELRIRRTLDGAEVDAVIAQAVAAKSLSDEHKRRDDWKRRQHNAADFMIEIVGHGSG